MTAAQRLLIKQNINKAFEEDTQGSLTKLRIELLSIIDSFSEEIALVFNWDKTEEEIVSSLVKNTTPFEEINIERIDVGVYAISVVDDYFSDCTINVSVGGYSGNVRYSRFSANRIYFHVTDESGNAIEETEIELSVFILKKKS